MTTKDDARPAYWLRVTAEIVENGEPVQLDDGRAAYATYARRIFDLSPAADRLPEMSRKSFEVIL